MEKKSFYITTTLPYVNAELHMGHALEFVRADAIARYKKLSGFDVFLNTGTDEHGMKIYEKAQSFGLSPQEFVDKSFVSFKESVKIFGMDEEILHFIRTTDENHIKAAQEFWQRCDKNGYIYKKNYQTKYCVGCECEKHDSELVNGECVDHPGKKIEIIEEENYFFKYSEFSERLLKFYSDNPNFVIPDFRFNEIKAFVERGLRDFSISRLKEKMPWGIPVPGDEMHVMYVWFDALVNYISTLGWPNSPSPLKGEGRGEVDLFERYWVNGTPTQYCGKDNLRFQSAMWQAMLMAAEVPNSYQIIIDGFITAEGGVKMSKSLGNVVDPKEIVQEYSTDALRYFLLREVSSFEDSPFTMERFKDAYNSGLANGLGNLVSRVMTLSEQYCEPHPGEGGTNLSVQIDKAISNFDISKAINVIWGEIKDMDNYIATERPFSIIKTDLNKGKSMISNLVNRLFAIGVALKPFMPNTSDQILNIITQNKKPEQPLFLRKD